MLILVIIAAIGIPAFFKIVEHFEQNSYYGFAYGTSISDELDRLNDYSGSKGLTGYDKEYADVLEFVMECGAESTYDWRYIAMTETFYSVWNMAYEEAYDDDEVADYMMHIENGDEGYTIEEGEQLHEKKALQLLTLLRASKEYTAAKNAVTNNDMTAWYNYLLDMAEAEKPSDTAAPDYAMQSELHELNVWLLTYLRDNEVYYGYQGYDGDWVRYEAGELYDERFYDACKILALKRTVVYYNYGQESASSYSSAMNELTLRDYIAENNIEYNVADNAGGSIDSLREIDMWSVFYITSMAITFVGLLVIVVAAMSVSSEFSNGTIKFLLINPVKRWKILVAKYFTVISIGYIMIAVMFVLSLISSMLLFGGSLITADHIVAKGGEVIVTNGIVFMLKTYLLSSAQVVVMSTIAFAVSVLMKSSAFAIGISMLGMLAGKTVILILSMLHQDWARYLIFANLDLASIARGQGTFMYQTTGSALAVIAVHMALLWLIAWDGFTRREV